MENVRTEWTLDEVEKIYHTPLMELIYRAATVHRQYHDPEKVQLCTLLSVKTGGCSEDCAYCPQSSRYTTGTKPQKLMDLDVVLEAARKAKENGSTRFCMGAAWRHVRENREFEKTLEMVKEVKKLGLQVCCTLGMLTKEQAQQLKEAGVYAYNHNLDSSEKFYNTIITTRTYQERLSTLKNVRDAGMTVCCGGIIGMGETEDDRAQLLHTLATLPKHPESVPINALLPVKGTPLGERPIIPIWDMVRVIATARILMPKSVVRLSAGRVNMSNPDQALCFMAGANSIFVGDKLLVTSNPETNRDRNLLNTLGLKPLQAPAV